MATLSMADSFSKYHHIPLDETRQQLRLLKVLPAITVGDTLTHEVSLEVFEQDSAPPYTALSYVWGSAENMKPIRVESSFLWIRENLHRFFEHYRDIQKPSNYLWIDQLCIDQENVDEKSHQVARMAQIYGNASEVLAWLGSYERASIAVEALKLVSKKGKNLHEGDLSSEQRKEIAIMFDCSYWNRLWIAQEIILARNCHIMYGREIFPWLDFCASSEPWYGNSRGFWHGLGVRASNSCFYTLAVLSSHTKSNEEFFWTWHSAMQHVVWSECSDPRDKIFGLQGIFPDSLQVTVDYSLAPLDVFRQAAWVYSQCFDSRWMALIDLIVNGLYGLVEGMKLIPDSIERESLFTLERTELWKFCCRRRQDMQTLAIKRLVFDSITQELLTGKKNTKLSEAETMLQSRRGDHTEPGLIARILEA